ncbi:MAG: UDP-N-acetylmuramoyl-L-alanine--D-glutamate ligase [Calditrichaceae bacterium]|nr:UDP-N-acetylmuramoyl-L-alanine--D-glutamate ligase [Calditrichia bacterium]NUQ40168.1 UDP-N-acetylmuramoyl-L-alanine--D-glutamate ligase [Calditrichaceae bacterium]
MFEISHHNRENRQRLKGASVAVLGAARSGIALAELLASAGARVLLSEQKSRAATPFSGDEIALPGVSVEFGGHSERVLESDLICISPGIPLAVPALVRARERGIPILGELEVSSWFCPAPVIAITGSNGKTTTTQLTGEIFKQRFERVLVGGNIGSPLAAEIRRLPDPQAVILEVSSFQLETIANFRPRVAVIMNLSPNHLDRYPDYESYVQAKLQILRSMEEEDLLIYCADDEFLSRRIAASRPQKIPFSISRELQAGAFWRKDAIEIRWQRLNLHIPVQRTLLRGPHNRYNMAAAALLGTLHGIPANAIRGVLENFPGVEHRLEAVRTIEGVQFVNDSKATTVASLGYALQSFREPIILIAGGKDKGGDFSEINELLKKHARAVIVIGEASRRMAEAWERVVPVYQAASLEEAVSRSRALARPGEVVLLSPACSSFDMFRDYEERGRRFKELVKKMNVLEGGFMVL